MNQLKEVTPIVVLIGLLVMQLNIKTDLWLKLFPLFQIAYQIGLEQKGMVSIRACLAMIVEKKILPFLAL